MGIPTAPAELGAMSEAPCPGFCELLHLLDGDHLFDNESDCYLCQACLEDAYLVICQGYLETADLCEQKPLARSDFSALLRTPTQCARDRNRSTTATWADADHPDCD